MDGWIDGLIDGLMDWLTDWLKTKSRSSFIGEFIVPFVKSGNILMTNLFFISRHPLWIDQVTNADYATAKSLLMELHGVGAKVADCVLLMSLGHHGAVPVDTHVFSVTADHYLPKLRGIKSVTPRVYNEIGAFYRDRFGPMAGWAHSILFTADLARFKEKKKATAGPESTATAKKRRKGTSTWWARRREMSSTTDCLRWIGEVIIPITEKLARYRNHPVELS